MLDIDSNRHNLSCEFQVETYFLFLNHLRKSSLHSELSLNSGLDMMECRVGDPDAKSDTLSIWPFL
jgi:hypothetical protein